MEYYHSDKRYKYECPPWYLREQWKMHQIKGMYRGIITNAYQPPNVIDKTIALCSEALYNEVKVVDLTENNGIKLDYEMHLDHQKFGMFSLSVFCPFLMCCYMY